VIAPWKVRERGRDGPVGMFPAEKRIYEVKSWSTDSTSP
jgi:hypothetical protein